MANKSDASGSIVISVNTKRTIEELYELLTLLNKGEYYTSMNPIEDGKTEEWINDYNYTFTVKFDACGSWNYENNIESMFRTIDTFINLCKDNTKRERYLNLVESVEMADFKIEFDYVDYEVGFDLFGNYIYSYTHAKGQKLTDLEMTEGECYELDLTIPALCKFLGYSLDKAIEEFSYRFDDMLKDVIEEEKEMIEEYANKPFAEIVQENPILKKLYS